jgi:hypothetical protein
MVKADDLHAGLTRKKSSPMFDYGFPAKGFFGAAPE